MPLIESERVAVACELLGETERAWLLLDGSRRVWLPKEHLIEYDARSRVAILPLWLATEKRLI